MPSGRAGSPTRTGGQADRVATPGVPLVPIMDTSRRECQGAGATGVQFRSYASFGMVAWGIRRSPLTVSTLARHTHRPPPLLLRTMSGNNCGSNGSPRPTTSLNACSRPPNRTSSSPSSSARPVRACSATNSPPGSSNATSAAMPTPAPPTSRHRAAPSVANRPVDGRRLPSACHAGNSRRRPGRWSGNASNGGVRPVGSLFFPLDQRLRLGTEGYSPSLLRKIVRQGGKAPCFREAAEDLQELARVTISPAHVRDCANELVASGPSGRNRRSRAIKTANCRGATRRRPRWPP